MATFTGEPLELKIGDIVIERHLTDKYKLDDGIAEYYWVIYAESKKSMYASTRKGYYAFLLSDANNTIGPVVFRSTELFEYKVIRYD
jgi:hypothetical protein